MVTGFTITNPGSGYTSAPRVRIADGQTLTITATSNNLTLIPNPTFSYTSPGNTSGVLTYTPAANTIGTATITFTVMDSGGTANGGVDTLTQTFNVTVTQVNQPPTLDPIIVTNPVILENAGQQTINLTGISPGPGDTGQTVTITATSNNTSVIPNPTIIYTTHNTTGMLTFTPVPFTMRLGDDHRHRDGQRRHRQRRRGYHPANLHRGGPAGQPGAHAQSDPQPRHAARERHPPDGRPQRHLGRPRRHRADPDDHRHQQQHDC